mgnify:CR=1 FL=1
MFNRGFYQKAIVFIGVFHRDKVTGKFRGNVLFGDKSALGDLGYD